MMYPISSTISENHQPGHDNRHERLGTVNQPLHWVGHLRVPPNLARSKGVICQVFSVIAPPSTLATPQSPWPKIDEPLGILVVRHPALRGLRASHAVHDDGLRVDLVEPLLVSRIERLHGILREG